MTIRNYISQRFASLGLGVSDADLLDMGLFNPDEEVNSDADLYQKFVKFIPQILLRPDSVSEGGTSIKRASKDDIISFYKSECKRLGLADELASVDDKPKPKVIFR